MMPLSHVATQSFSPCRFLLLPPRDAQHLLSRQHQHFHASAACSFWRQTAHGTHIHKLRLCQRAVAVLVEDSPHNIQQIGPQLQGGIGEEKCERRLRGESLRMAVGGIGVCFSWRERLV